MIDHTTTDAGSRRQEALDRYGIMDTAPEPSFDEVAILASEICEAPVALVVLVGKDRQFFKADVGFGRAEPPIEMSFCTHALASGDFLQVPDATRDARFADNPLVTDEGVRFYAGAVLHSEDGLPIGSLCVLDKKPRTLTPLQERTLKVLASQITGQLNARLALKQRTEDEQRYRALFDTMDEGFCIIEFLDGPHGPLSDYIHVEANAAYARHAGIPDVVGQRLREMVPDEADAWVARYGHVLRTGEPIRFEQELVATGRHLSLSSFRLEPPERRQVAVLFQDITGRRRAEAALQDLNQTLEARVDAAVAERAQAEEALRQAQKMEAVGQLTGGLAHDFNNLLTGISGAFEMIETRLSQGRIGELERYLNAGQGAARRAAALTHRLLAFSRRQTLSPKPLVVNRLMSDLAELVRRTVGPSIEVETIAAGGLWPTLVDANQLENAILNLCINARDAMPGGGRITIETGNKWLDRRAAAERGMEAGQYVTVCVSDTGAGIEKSILDRVFDPFFTTKPIGEGTGLGLSMVYGFARQSHGHVRIYSEVGQGTMVCIYLPRYFGAEDSEVGDGHTIDHAPTGAGETVLVIDDEPTIRMLIVDALGELGYACAEAADGPSGLAILQSSTRIDLLITDVGLPGGLNGRQVADAARVLRPELKVLFITGYAENAALNHGHIERGMELITKPFAINDLAARVERLLHADA